MTDDDVTRLAERLAKERFNGSDAERAELGKTLARHVLAARPTPAADDAMVAGLREWARSEAETAVAVPGEPDTRRLDRAALLTAAADRLAGLAGEREMAERSAAMQVAEDTAAKLHECRQRLAATEAETARLRRRVAELEGALREINDNCDCCEDIVPCANCQRVARVLPAPPEDDRGD